MGKGVKKTTMGGNKIETGRDPQVHLKDLFRGSLIVIPDRGDSGDRVTLVFGVDPERETPYAIHLVGEQDGQEPWNSGAWGGSPEAAIQNLEPVPRAMVISILLERGVIFPDGSAPR